MTSQPAFEILHPGVEAYIASLATETDPLVIRMACYAREHGFPWLGHDAAVWLELLASMVQARRVFEFGSGFGYSAYFLARAVGEEGEVHGSEPAAALHAAHAQLFGAHPYRSRIHLHEGDGATTLAALDGTFDLIFIDLDKPLYPAALDAAIPRVRVGGLVVADNVLWGGRVTKPAGDDDPSTAALCRFNERTHADARLKTCILPVGDGLSVSWRVR